MLSFVILHYKNIEETLLCLEKIKENVSDKDVSIVVVDNHTLIKSDKEKIEKYTEDILMLEENLGFAKANNKGILYAKKKYNPNFYCVMNNDVFISQKNFIKEIKQVYKKYKFDMLGPKIDSPSGESVNPFPVLDSLEKVKQEIDKCKKLIKIYNSSLLTQLLKIYVNIKKIFIKIEKPVNAKNVLLQVPLHGCAIIFSKKYIEKYQDVFYNETFLFHEEEFLYHRVLRDNLISVYDPDLEVFHKEGSSIKADLKSIRLSKLFREQERLKSLELLLKEM